MSAEISLESRTSSDDQRLPSAVSCRLPPRTEVIGVANLLGQLEVSRPTRVDSGAKANPNTVSASLHRSTGSARYTDQK